MKVKPNKENIITDILFQLEKGTERSACLAKVGKKWQISIRTFDRLWKESNTRHLAIQQSIQLDAAELIKEAEKERLKNAIATKDKVLEELTKIGMGELELENFGKLQTANFNERISAFKAMADFQGWKAPIKTDITTGGEKLNPSKPDLSKLSPEALSELLNSFTDDGNGPK